MRLRFLSSSLASHVAVFALGMLMAWFAMPVWRLAVMELNQERYGLLVQQCDVAMRDHFQAKQSAQVREGAAVNSELEAAELGLLVCQDYDIYQKKLTTWGLRENEIASMRLRAIEARSSDLDEVIEIHEIRY